MSSTPKMPRCFRCARRAKHAAYFLGIWRPLCRYHIGAYYDLPQRRLITAETLRELRAVEA